MPIFGGHPARWQILFAVAQSAEPAQHYGGFLRWP